MFTSVGFEGFHVDVLCIYVRWKFHRHRYENYSNGVCFKFIIFHVCFFQGTLDKSVIIWDLRENTTDEFETFAMNRLTAKRDYVVRLYK